MSRNVLVMVVKLGIMNWYVGGMRFLHVFSLSSMS